MYIVHCKIVLLEVKIEPCGVCQWSVFISVQKSQRSMARAVAVLQNLIWEFELDGPKKQCSELDMNIFPTAPKWI